MSKNRNFQKAVTAEFSAVTDTKNRSVYRQIGAGWQPCISVMCMNFGLGLAFISIDSLFVFSRFLVMTALHFGQSASNQSAEVYVESTHVLLA